MNTLAVDIGNSSAKALLFDGGEVDPIEAASAVVRSTDEARALIQRAVAGRQVDAVGFCSVVPAVSAHFEPLWGSGGLPVPMVVGPDTAVPFRVEYETRASLGADRIAVVAGAWSLMHSSARVEAHPLLVVDAGTATTIEVVDRRGVYRGGPILAGPGIVRAALTGGTAQLPQIELEVPESAIGRSTREALQSGIVYGYIDAVRGGLQRLLDEVGHDATVVATGGWSALLAAYVSAVEIIRPNLVLEGIEWLVSYAAGRR